MAYDRTSRATDSEKPDVVRKVRECLSQAWDHERDNRIEASQDLNFLAGDQWPEAIRVRRELEGRPMLTINRLPQFVRQVTNDIRQAQIGIRVRPSDGAVARAERVMDLQSMMRAEQQGQGQPQKQKPMLMSDVMDGMIREIQYQSSANHVYATAAEHQVACGIGHFRIVTEYADDVSLEQVIRLKSINRPLTVYWDPAATEIDRSDAQWCVVTELIPRKTFQELYPDAAEQEVETYDESHHDFYWSSSDELRIAEYWCKKPVKRKIAQLPDGRIVDVDDDEVETMLVAEGASIRTVKTHKVEQYIVTGAEILEGPVEWAGKQIPIIPVIGSEIPLDNKVLRHGLIRFARDPQQLYNFARTSAAESMGQAPKAPWLVTPNMIKAFKGMWDDAAKSLRPYLLYEPDPDATGTGGVPKREPAPEVPMAYVNEAQIADGDIKATVGIYDPQLGQRSNENSGKAILAREQQGDTGTYHYVDNLRRALECCGRQLVDLIPKVYDNERVIRILGEDDSELYVPINAAAGYDEQGNPRYINDLTQGRYDCKVTIGPSYATKRQESAEAMMQFMQAYPPAAQVLGDLVAKNMDWPGSDAIADRLRKLIPPEVLGEDAPQQPPNPMEQMAQQLQLENVQLTNAKLNAEIERMNAEAENKQADTQMILASLQELAAKIEHIGAQSRQAEAQAYKTTTEADLMPYEVAQREFDSAAERDMRREEISERNRAQNGARQNGESDARN